MVSSSVGLRVSLFVTTNLRWQLIYRVQFPVMQGYERDTWYDHYDRIVFTNSKGLVGIGLPRKRGKKVPEITLTFPDGSVATTTDTDYPLPGGARTAERRYTAPFALANREEDYKITWAFFESRQSATAGSVI